MRLAVPSRKALGVAAMTLVVSSLGLTAGVFVARPAAAASSATTTSATTGATALPSPSGSNPAAAKYFVINGTAHAASAHEIVGSSAFPNYATGAVDNYYSMAKSHVDNSPFAEGTASPFDTGPVGQTAAAGNTQQPQYADARWPGNSGKASYGSPGQPYAVAEASEYRATAESSEASSGLSAPSGSSQMATPKGFNGRLRQALAAWKEKWQGPLRLKTPTGEVKTPTPTVTVTPTVTTPTATVTTPAATVTTPTVTTPSVTVGGPPATPTVSVPLPAVPPAAAPQRATPSRSLSSSSTAPADGASLLESSSLATLETKSGALLTSGESRVGRVSIGGGQIMIEGIHVAASITNDGSPTNKVAVSVGAASIGGVPVTIDQDGVHVAGQSQSLPYQQASDALNGALKQAGIQLFLVAPEIKTNSCDQSGTANGTTTTTTTNSSDQTSTNSTTSSCDQSGMNTTTSSCDQTGTNTTTTSSGLPATPVGTTTTPTTTTTSSSNQPGTSSTTSSCGQTDTNSTTSSCGQTGTTTTTSSDQTGTTTTTSSADGTGTGTTNSGAETVTATGLHVVFTQPVSQSGVPAQYAEHILGEVSLDSLAVPAGDLPNLNLSSSFSSPSLSSSCPNGRHSGKTKTSGGASKGGGGSSAGGSSSSSSPSPFASNSSSIGSSQPTSGFTAGGSQLTSSSAGPAPQSFPARLASALRKPMWLLLAYLLWQALVIATGASLWTWRRDGAS